MKKFMLLIVFCLVTGSFTFAQSPLAELDKVKEIKLLESTRDDVVRIFADYNSDLFDEPQHYEWFSSKNAKILVRYSNGKCSDTWGEDWNVSEWKVTVVEIALTKPIKVKDFGIDLSKYKKERIYSNLSDSFMYHDKSSGIGFEVYKNEVYRITFIPSKENYSSLCDNEGVKKYYSSKSWFSDKLKERRYIREYKSIANVAELTLSKDKITADCAVSVSPETKSCSDETKIISVETIAEDADNDVLTYQYTVSGGKIIGQGQKVSWDLSGVKPGDYTITAGVDDGCGVCGKTITKTVVVKECPDCSQK